MKSGREGCIDADFRSLSLSIGNSRHGHNSLRAHNVFSCYIVFSQLRMHCRSETRIVAAPRGRGRGATRATANGPPRRFFARMCLKRKSEKTKIVLFSFSFLPQNGPRSSADALHRTRFKRTPKRPILLGPKNEQSITRRRLMMKSDENCCSYFSGETLIKLEKI